MRTAFRIFAVLSLAVTATPAFATPITYDINFSLSSGISFPLPAPSVGIQSHPLSLTSTSFSTVTIFHSPASPISCPSRPTPTLASPEPLPLLKKSLTCLQRVHPSPPGTARSLWKATGSISTAQRAPVTSHLVSPQPVAHRRHTSIAPVPSLPPACPSRQPSLSRPRLFSAYTPR